MRALVVVLLALAGCRSTPAAEPVSATTPKAATAAEPKQGKIKIVTDTKVEILDPIKFLPGSPAIEPTSVPIIDAVANTLAGNPSIKLVAVQAFGPDTVAKFQAQLGADRARAIVDALVARGVDRKRLIAEGNAQPPAGGQNIPIFLILERTD